MGLELKIKGITTAGELPEGSLFLRDKIIFLKPFQHLTDEWLKNREHVSAIMVGDNCVAGFEKTTEVFELEIKDYGNNATSLPREGD